MRTTISVKREREVLSLVTNISYANVSSWYDATRRDLHNDIQQ